MRFAVLSFTLLLTSYAHAAYDGSWYQTDFWSGEWPAGFSVPKAGIKISARTTMDKNVPPNAECELPYKALFNEWNQSRKATYRTASKIVKLKAKTAIELSNDDGHSAKIAAGEEFEYLIYLSEGSFMVRVKGQELTADQSLFDKVEKVPETAYEEDQWLNLDCVNGVNAWIFMNDLTMKDANGDTVYKYGLWNGGIGAAGVDGYGEARDLTDAEIANGGPLH